MPRRTLDKQIKRYPDSGAGSGQPPISPASRPRSWLQVWTYALAQPTIETLEVLLNEPGVSLRRGVRWVLGAAFAASGLHSVVIALTILPYIIADPLLWPYPIITPIASLISLSCLWPLLTLINFALLAVSISLLHLFARATGGKSSFGPFAYLVATYWSPLIIIYFALQVLAAALFAPETGQCITYVFWVAYSLYLFDLTLKALRVAHRLEPSTALAVVFSVVLVSGIAGFILNTSAQRIVALLFSG